MSGGFWSYMFKKKQFEDEETSQMKFGLAKVFKYAELKTATNNFATELGEGGYGKVYLGRLGDGQMVAVKVLFGRSTKRIEQFFNEVTVLSRLRHKNLVSLLGCTDPTSKELLLVYEYVPNGTVADHIHGKKSILNWAVRIQIAVETADALAYLHGQEPLVIHRDVKTANILVDNAFHAKVADLGICRLLPWDATHVSTVAQGTMGYRDPEYDLYLRLSDKTDVYSFGVVLMELITGMQAVDVDRDLEDIYLDKMSVTKIINKRLEDFVHPILGYQSNIDQKRRIDSVAELARKCLQPQGEMRPQMLQVLAVLKGIQNEIQDMGLDGVGVISFEPPQDLVMEDTKDKKICGGMSVVGLDFGNESCIIAVAQQRDIDVVLNDNSKRKTPAIVCFGDKQRFIGTAGAASSMMNPKNSISQIKRLLGRRFADPELQRDIQSMPFKVTEAADGSVLIHASYLREQRTFTPTQLLGMVLFNLKEIAQKNLNAGVIHCCIGIPVYFTDLQRRAMIDAANIAGLHLLRLFHETTATALGYGIYKTDLPETDPINVAFVDVGHASMQVCIAGFKKEQLKILAHSYDRSLGGRDFDEALFTHFAAKFKEEYKIDVYQNARACLRLRAGCEKLKKVLSANPEAPLNIECLMDEKDVRGFIKREEFEQISIPILKRVKGPLEKALVDAGLTVDNIHSVEVVGSGSRVPAIIRILTEFFRKEPRRAVNASECVARGCALQCTMLSPTFKVREFQVHESSPFPIALSWKGSSPDVQTIAGDNQRCSVVFPKGNPIPSVKALTFFRSSTFTVDAIYTDPTDLQVSPKISTYTIGPFQSAKDERAKLKVKVRLNIHGIVSVESATMLEEEESEIPVKEVTKMETEAGNDASQGDVNMQDAKKMETEVKADVPKKKVKKTDIPVAELVYGAPSKADLQKAVEKEFEMGLQDRIVEDTKDRKNAVDAYVYDMRNKLHDKYNDFVTTPEKDEFSSKLLEVEDWLYDDGEDETKGVYVAKLEELKKQGDPIEERYKEWVERGRAINILVYCLNSFRDAAMSKDPIFDHIDVAERQKVINECQKAERWLKQKGRQQDVLPKYATPVLLAADLRRKTEALDRFAKPIMTKPKPAPAKS